MGIGDWGLGIGDWGLGIGPNPQSPIPNNLLTFKNFFAYVENFINNKFFYNNIKLLLILIIILNGRKNRKNY